MAFNSITKYRGAVGERESVRQRFELLRESAQLVEGNRVWKSDPSSDRYLSMLAPDSDFLLNSGYLV